MKDGNDLEKLFEAALNEEKAPSRFHPGEELKKTAPAAFRQPASRPAPHGGTSPFIAAPPLPQTVSTSIPGAAPTSQPSASAFQATTPLVQRDVNGEASLDQAINAELAEIMDAKIARMKRRRRRAFLFSVLFFVGVIGGAAGWVVVNPDRLSAFKAVISEIKSMGDIQGMVAKYQKALDRIAERGKQIDTATVAMGVDPTSVEGDEDPGFDKEMKAMMGENGGKTTAARDKLLREKFKSAAESGSLIPGKPDGEDEKKLQNTSQ